MNRKFAGLLVSCLFFLGGLNAQINQQLNFNLTNVQLTDTLLNNATYQVVNYNGLSQSAEIGKPALPVRYIRFLIPIDKEFDALNVTSAFSSEISIANPVMSVLQPVPLLDSETVPDFTTSGSAYDENLWPSEPAIYMSTGVFDQYNKIITIAVYPLTYSSLLGKLTFHSDIQVSITLKNAANARSIPNIARSNKNQDLYKSILSSLIENPQDISSYSDTTKYRLKEGGNSSSWPMPLPAYEYVIITDASLASAFDEFVAWKKQKGIDIGIVTTQEIYSFYTADYSWKVLDMGSWMYGPASIQDNAGCIREYLKDAYHNGTTYVLLGGDHSIVPARTGATRNNVDQSTGGNLWMWYFVPTDWYYADLTGDWNVDNDEAIAGLPRFGEPIDDNVGNYPNVFVGRVICHTNTQVHNWSQNVIAYEKVPANHVISIPMGGGTYDYLSNSLLIQADQCQAGNEAPFIVGKFSSYSSFMNQEVLGETPSEEQIYDANGNIISTTTPGATMGNSVIAKLNRVEDGVMLPYGLISFFGHGTPRTFNSMTSGVNGTPAWAVTSENAFNPASHISENQNGIDNLTTTDYPSLVYSVACDQASLDKSSGTPTSSPYYGEIQGYMNFAESFTTNENSGAAAFFGNSRWGWTPSSSQLFGMFVDQLYLPGSPDPCTKIGVAEGLSKAIFNASGAVDMFKPQYYLLFSHNLIGCPETNAWVNSPLHFFVTSTPSQFCAGIPGTFTATIHCAPGRKIRTSLVGDNDFYLTSEIIADQYGNAVCSYQGVQFNNAGTVVLTVTADSYQPYIAEIPVICCPINQTPKIVTTETWTSDVQNINQWVHVPAGVTLTIKSRIGFSGQAGIRIAPGGKLILDGGVLTSSCNNTWKGILVEGNPGQSQFVAGNQGVVEIKNNGTIENAVCGISVLEEGTSGTSTGGGIVRATNALFVNCVKAVEFAPYKNVYNGLERNNLSRFVNCKFETNVALYNNGLDPETFVDLKGISGIYFKGCDFQNTDIENLSGVRGYGIKSADAKFFVAELTQGVISPSPDQDSSRFRNLEYGILINNTNPLMTVSVVNTSFFNNNKAICLFGVSNLKISNNTIDVGANAGPANTGDHHNDAFGIYLEGCTRYTVQSNVIKSTHDGRYGLIIANSGHSSNVINNNIIKDFEYAIQIEGCNGFSSVIPRSVADGVAIPYASGLVVKCNEFSSNSQFDIGLTNYTATNGLIYMGNIYERQGYCATNTSPAGNLFNSACLLGNLYSATDVSPYEYSFHNGGGNTNPSVYNPLVTKNACAEVYSQSACALPDPNQNVTALKNIISLSSLDITVLAERIDGGNTQGMISEISLPGASSQELFNILMDASPYLSDTVLVSMIHRSEAMTPGHTKDVVVANSPLAGRVMNELTYVPMPAGIRRLIANAQTGISSRSQLEGQIAEKQTELFLATDALLQTILNDSMSTGTNEIGSFFSNLPDVESRKIAAEAYLAAGNCTGLQEVLNTIPLNSDENVSFYKYYTIMKDLCISGLTIEQLTPQQISQVSDLTSSGTSLAVNARNILALLTNIPVEETIEKIASPYNDMINGYLYENTDCGITPVAGDTLVIIDYAGNIMKEITPVVTTGSGWFVFNGKETSILKDNKYTISSKGSFSVDSAQYFTIDEWVQNSPLQINLARVAKVWESSYNSPDSVFATGQTVVIQSSIYSIGTAYNQNKDKDILIMKNDPSGNVIWNTLYNSGSGSDDLAAGMVIDSLQNIYVLGTVGEPGRHDISLIKYDSNGLYQWATRYNYNDLDDNGTKISRDHSGNILLTGTVQANTGNMNVAVLKYNTSGQLIWSAIVPGYDAQALFPVGIYAQANGFTTVVVSDTAARAKTTMVKYDLAGKLMSTFTISDLNACAFIQDEAGNNYVAGNRSNTLEVDVRKLDNGFKEIWKISLYGSMENSANSDYLGLDSLGNLTVLSYSKMGFSLLKIDAQGNKNWSKENLGGWFYFLYKLDMTMDKFGNAYVAATAEYKENILTNYVYLYKFDPSGNLMWSQENKRNTASDISVSENLNVYVNGTKLYYLNNSATPTYGFVTHKYSQCYSGINLRTMQTIQNADSNTNYYFSLYPNPNNGSMQIEFTHSGNEKVMFEIYDPTGKIVYLRQLPGGSGKFPLSIEGLKSGVYYYRAYTSTQSLVNDKVVIIK